MGERRRRRRSQRRRAEATRRKVLLGGVAATAVILSGGVGWFLFRNSGHRSEELKPVRFALAKVDGPADARSRAPAIPGELLPFIPIEVYGPGNVTLSNSLLDGFLLQYPNVQATTAYVSPSGRDASGVADDETKPFATIPAALKAADTVILEDGDYPPFELETGIKFVRARNPGKVRLAVPGGEPHRIIDPARLDRDGFPVRVPLNQGLRPGLQPIYMDKFESAQVLVSRATLCLHGIDYHGVTVRSEGGEVWVSHFTSFAAPNFAFVTIGGEIYLESGRIHASRWDGWNCDWDNDRGTIVAAGVVTTESGDFSVFGRGDAFNRQAGSSHSGYLAAFACIARRSMGEEYADTSVAGVPNISWYVGCIVGDDAHASMDGGIGFHFAGHGPGGREAYLDTCRAEGLPIPLILETGAVAFTNDCNFEEVRFDPEDPLTARNEAFRQKMISGDEF